MSTIIKRNNQNFPKSGNQQSQSTNKKQNQGSHTFSGKSSEKKVTTKKRNSFSLKQKNVKKNIGTQKQSNVSPKLKDEIIKVLPEPKEENSKQNKNKKEFAFEKDFIQNQYKNFIKVFQSSLISNTIVNESIQKEELLFISFLWENKNLLKLSDL
ncbi:hypothetical protein ACFL2K_04230, partial [Candidatus Margulisiibacteriota bacterium]